MFADLFHLLSIPSVSCDPARTSEVLRAGEEVRRLMTVAGLQAELVPTSGFPVAVGRWQKRPDRPTVLIYGHYDVQPEAPVELWTTPPFQPSVRDGKVYARGATDDKGQFLAHIKAIEQLLAEEGELPVNVIVVIEGEEEIGSLHFPEFLRANLQQLVADVFVVSDGTMWNGVPTLVYGLRGICFVQIDLKGPGAGFALCRMLATLKDEHGKVQIPGFYDRVAPLTDEERELLAALPFDPDSFRREMGVPGLSGELGFTPLEQRMARPTLEIHGLEAGPEHAMAKITCRLVMDQSPPDMAVALRSHLEARVPAGLQAEFVHKGGGRPWLTPHDHPALRAAARAIRIVHDREPLYAREGGTIPVVIQIQEALGIPGILLGFGLQSENLHAPDEHFHLHNYQMGIRTSKQLLHELAK